MSSQTIAMSSEFEEFVATVSATVNEVEANASSNDLDSISYLAVRLEAALDGVRFLQLKFLNLDPDRHRNQEFNDFLSALNVFERRLNELWSCVNSKMRSSEQLAFSAGFVESSGASAGRPKYNIKKEQLEFLRYELHFKWTDIASLLGVSVSTVNRRRQELGIDSHANLSDLTDEELDNMVRNISREQPYTGLSLIEGHLRRTGFRLSRERIRQSLLRIDPVNVALRYNQAVSRRQYSVPGPNSLWHIDSNHKLIRWRFVVHGGIDGSTRVCTYIGCATNNTADTTSRAFLSATDEYGWPSRVRSDKGTENVGVAVLMNSKRGTGRSSHIAGSSVHNQRIERLWRDYFRCVGAVYHQLFHFMEDHGIMDANNEQDLFCLHYVFLPRINNSLNLFRSAWNNHRMRTEGNKSPNQLYTQGMLRLFGSNLTAVRDVFDSQPIHVDEEWYGVDETTGPFPEVQTNNDVQVPQIPQFVDSEQIDLLRQTINPLDSCTNFGIPIYLETKAWLTRNLRATYQ